VKLVRTRQEVREAVATARGRGARVGLVPTMGFLHQGHLSLLEQARAKCEWTALSIFVNPLQFGPSEDLDRYPRDLERDLEMARGAGADLVFAPSAAEMYPGGEPRVAVVAGAMSERLCGATRPGHFRGVLTVVAKLLGIFTPDLAVFGQKDYQQAALIRAMVEDLDLPVEVRVAPTVREADGLAMSSRNAYLTEEERSLALRLHAALQSARALFAEGERDSDRLRREMRSILDLRGIQVEYAEVVEPATLEPAARAEAGCVFAIAARIGSTRLIDNLILD
jgi:pantoate--beta-alanine ligase